MDISKIGNNTYALYRKYKVMLPTGINWFSPFPGYDNDLPKEVESIVSITPFDYSNIIDNVNLIIKTNDIKKRKVILYLIISLVIGCLVPILKYAPWYILMITCIIVYSSIFILITKLILSINNMKNEVDQKIKEFNSKYFETLGIKFTFKTKKNTTRNYPYKLRLLYPLSQQQLELIRQFQNIDKQYKADALDQIINVEPHKLQQQNQPQKQQQQQSSSSSSKQNENQQQIIDIGFDNDFGDYDDNYDDKSSLLQK
ncbi:hypothetical protein ACTFIY_011904 [Dictyostelium cf. discoideum]